MSKNRNILQSFLACLLVLAILLPSSYSLAHSLENHHHADLCDNPSDIHVHEKQLDCNLDLLAFKKNGVFAFAKAISFYSYSSTLYSNTYTSLIHTERLETEPSRGPPMC